MAYVPRFGNVDDEDLERRTRRKELSSSGKASRSLFQLSTGSACRGVTHLMFLW